MGSNRSIERCRWWYEKLLRLYPRPFRERFGQGMAQSFDDLCRERRSKGRGLFRLALWVFGETLVGIIRENITHMPKTVLRVALGALAALMVPLIASQFVPDWHWGVSGFAFAYVAFFLVGMGYAVISRRMGAWSYKAGVGLALAAGFGLAWSNMVHVTGTENPTLFLYFSVLAVGVIGAGLARLNAGGLARTLFAMAAVMLAISMLLPSGAPPDIARRMAIGHAGLVVVFAASGLLFRHASLHRVK